MAHAEITKLLKLQDSDTLKIQNEMRLAAIPREVAKTKAQIEEEEQAIEAAREQLKKMEIQRSEMRTDRKSMEEQIVKYKNQQIDVKKNEEYQALTLEIASLEEKIGTVEEEEIGLLMQIDEQKEVLAAEEGVIKERILLLEKDIERQKSRIDTLNKDTENLTNEVAEAAKAIDPKYYRAYENVKRRFKKPPFLVPIIEQKVNGLKVSQEIITMARKGDGPVIDDATGRLVYWPD